VDWQRNVLLAAIFAVFAVLFVRWNEFSEARQPKQITAANEAVYVPESPASPGTEMPSIDAKNGVPQSVNADAGERLIRVKTDVLDLVIDTRGGDIVRAALPEHPAELRGDSPPFLMLNRTRDQIYVAQSGLIGPNGTDHAEDRPRFFAEHADYSLGSAAELRVPLSYRQGSVLITKEFVLRPGSYLVDVVYQVDNRGTSPWIGHMFGQIQRDSHNPAPASNAFGMKSYLGAALSTQDENYRKVKFDDLNKKPFETELTGGWIAMVQHYFVSAWIPEQTASNHFKLRRLGENDLYALGFVGPERRVEPGKSEHFSAGFYVGPKDQARLGEIAPHLDLTIDYGWLWWIAKPVFAGLQLLHNWLGNWGWAIIAVTILVKLVFFPLSAASYRSMARMRKLQPEMQTLRERYGTDRQQLSQEVMALYKREKVNPMGGCLPMLIQMPVFIALYWVLSESVELRHAPWILWITDLSVRDPLYVLPVLNGISMYVLQTLQPAPPDPTQAKVMKVMPVMFSFFFVFFPAGLVLYWTVNSVLSIAQQWVITRRIIAE
jgi:YidC/Oxa1 family membrane protein insertase